MMTDLDRLDQLLAAVASRPWRYQPGDDWGHPIGYVFPTVDLPGDLVSRWTFSRPEAELIVEAVNALPELIAAARELKRRKRHAEHIDEYE